MVKKIRVLYTIPNFNTAGSGRSVYDLVKGLDKTIFEPEICCYHNKGAFFKEVEELGVPIHLFPYMAAYRPRLTFIFRVLKIRSFFKKHNFDVIHSWNWSSDISEPLAARLAGTPYIYTKKAMGWGNRFWTWRSKLSSKVIVVNEDMITLYFSKMLDKIVNFPLAIDTKRYAPMEASDKLRNSLGISETDFVIISVANLVPVKGVESLLEAIKLLDNKQIKTLIVGDYKNEYGNQLKSQFHDGSSVMFIGKQLDVKPYLAIANLFVIPTKDEGRKEGIPNAPLEAMAMKVPVIGSNISGIYDILKSFPDCMFQAGNVDEMSEIIERIRNLSESETKNLSEAMRKRVVDVFSIEDFLKNHQSLYLEILN